MGRPREFDVDQAIRIATDLFWRKGFEGTSVSDLTRAMGIATPSFYFAFENKEALFQRIVESYQKTQAKIVEDALSQKTTKAVVEKLLGGFADLLTDPDHAPGCLIMNSALPVVEGHGFRSCSQSNGRLSGSDFKSVSNKRSRTLLTFLRIPILGGSRKWW